MCYFYKKNFFVVDNVGKSLFLYTLLYYSSTKEIKKYLFVTFFCN